MLPLPTWLYLLLLIPALILSPKRLTPYKALRKPRTFRILRWIYSFLIFADLLLLSIEIARLVKLHYGVGLIPFVYFGHFIPLFTLFLPSLQILHRSWLNQVVWIGGLITSGLQLAELLHEPDDRKGTPYPVVDQVTDVGVMVGLYALLIGCEWWLKSCAGRNRRAGGDSEMELGG